MHGAIPSLQSVLSAFRDQKEISVSSALTIIHAAQEILSQEPNVVEISAEVVVYGDIHGQFFDFLHFAEESGIFNIDTNQSRKFLFLGDYVDRGAFSCEVMLTLLLLKIKHPHNIFLLRGNHECQAISSHYGFRFECKVKYGISLYYHFVRCFRYLPIASVVVTPYGNFLCIHGGLSPEISTLKELDSIDRNCEPDTKGALCDLLWADPIPESHRDSSKELRWQPNSIRGCSYHFGFRAVKEFLTRNGLICLIRAHELQDEGYHYHFTSNSFEENEFPLLITVFSAPNYCDKFMNKGAYLILPHEKGKIQMKQFEFVQHPKPKLFNRTKSVDLQGEVEKILPYIPASKQFFERMVELSKELNPIKTPVSRRASLPAVLDVCPTRQALHRSLSADDDGVLLYSTPRLSAEMHPETLRKMMDHAAGEWIGDVSQTSSPNEIVGDQLRRLVQQSNSSVENQLTDRSKIFSSKEMEVLKLLFSLMDINGDLVLRKEEVFHFIEHILGEKVEESDVDRYVEALDLNGDGAIEFTDLLQAVALMKILFKRDQCIKMKAVQEKNILSHYISVDLKWIMYNKFNLSILSILILGLIVRYRWILPKRALVALVAVFIVGYRGYKMKMLE